MLLLPNVRKKKKKKNYVEYMLWRMDNSFKISSITSLLYMMSYIYAFSFLCLALSYAIVCFV